MVLITHCNGAQKMSVVLLSRYEVMKHYREDRVLSHPSAFPFKFIVRIMLTPTKLLESIKILKEKLSITLLTLS